ncbi:MAG: hypothetical protein CMF62_12730 [Magnetococcales bacterium]|nr:hypothetical protein [Magnetococcales bacterium]|tara:strand:+ start:112725 stop:113480 length:756 start_codon:yes stop_codon:yes gene_type:complete
MTKKKDSNATSNAVQLQPTSFTEINRIHRQALSARRGSLVITSALGGEGVSTFAHMMALRSADNGQRTLLVDLNLRNGGLSEAFNAERKIWGLAGRELNEPLTDLIEPVEGVQNLSFMAAPRDDESVQFLRDVQRSKYFLTNLEHQFDQVVIDTTPVGALNRQNIDPVLLSAAASRAVVVFMAGVTPKDKIHRCVRQLEEAGATIEGLLVNDYRNPTLQEELLKFSDGVKRLSPAVGDWLRQKVLKSTFLS